MTEPLVCKSPGCGKTRTSSSPDFCADHEFTARQDTRKLIKETEIRLDLEAQFVAYCADKGLPHPHE